MKSVLPSRTVPAGAPRPFDRQEDSLLEIGPWQDPSRDGVLESEQARSREMRIVRLDRRLDLTEVERAVGAVGDGLRLDRAEHREAAGFIAVAVRLRAEDHFVSALAVAHQRGEVGLRPGR